MIKIKTLVQPPLIRIVAVIANVAEERGITLRISSGIDGKHSEFSGHYQLRSVDVGSKEHDVSMLPMICDDLRKEMGKYFPPSRVYVGIHSKGDRGENGNEHIHVQFK